MEFHQQLKGYINRFVTLTEEESEFFANKFEIKKIRKIIFPQFGSTMRKTIVSQ